MCAWRGSFFLAGTFFSLCLAVGCGPGGEVRNEISGEVIFQKKPLHDGIIEFEPLDGQGSKSGAHIQNGRYHIPGNKGLMPGRYRVRIVGGDGFSGAGDASPDTPRRPPGARLGQERIPAEYNAKSTVERVVKDGPNEFNFDIP